VTGHVVLLHGLWMPSAAMQWLASRLSAGGYRSQVFAYSSVTDGPDLAVPRLCETLRGCGPTHVVAHSLGGLIAMQALCNDADLEVPRMVCLGSPLRGSGAAAGLMRWPLSTLMLGRSAGLLREGLPCWQGRTEVGVIAGRVPHGLGMLFGQFDGDSDGTVAVEETRLDGATDHVVAATSHSGMLFSAEVADQTLAFLRHGRFDQARQGGATGSTPL